MDSRLERKIAAEKRAARYAGEKKAFFEAEEKRKAEQAELLEQVDALKRQTADLTETVRMLSNQIAQLQSKTDETYSRVSDNDTSFEETFDQGCSQMKEEMRQMIDLQIASQNQIREELCEKIHSESVKSYRNIKGLLTSEEMEEPEIETGVALNEESFRRIRRSFKGLKVLAWIGCIGAALFIYLFLVQMGFISFDITLLG